MKCLEFRAEPERVATPAVVEWLDPEAVSREGKRLCVSVPEREAKHTVESTECAFDTPARTSLEEGFGIGVAHKRPTMVFEIVPEIVKVVHFAVINHHIALAPGGHWLVSGGREI